MLSYNSQVQKELEAASHWKLIQSLPATDLSGVHTSGRSSASTANGPTTDKKRALIIYDTM